MHENPFSVIWTTFAIVSVAIVLPNLPLLFANEINDLKHIGTIEGKSFFIETTEQRTWDEALAYCQDAGMRMASLSSYEQRNLLTSQLNRFNYAWWLGARTTNHYFVLDPLLVTWSHNGETVDLESDGIGLIHANPNCLSIGAWTGDPLPGHPFSEVWSGECYDKRFTLCEFVAG